MVIDIGKWAESARDLLLGKRRKPADERRELPMDNQRAPLKLPLEPAPTEVSVPPLPRVQTAMAEKNGREA